MERIQLQAHSLTGTMLPIPLEPGVFFKRKLVGFEDALSKPALLTVSVRVCRVVCLCTLTLALSLRFVRRLNGKAFSCREMTGCRRRNISLKAGIKNATKQNGCVKEGIECGIFCGIFYRKKAKATIMSHINFCVPCPSWTWCPNLNSELCRQCSNNTGLI